MIKFEDLQRDDIEYIEDLINSSELYLQDKLSDEEIITRLNGISTIYLKYEDQYLLMFKGIWSDVYDIKEEIRKGKMETIELDSYIKDDREIMRKACNNLVERYTPLLKQLRKKFPTH
jgi:hypothetical protein